MQLCTRIVWPLNVSDDNAAIGNTTIFISDLSDMPLTGYPTQSILLLMAIGRLPSIIPPLLAPTE